jgi:hypothetical protein
MFRTLMRIPDPLCATPDKGNPRHAQCTPEGEPREPDWRLLRHRFRRSLAGDPLQRSVRDMTSSRRLLLDLTGAPPAHSSRLGSYR